MSLEPVPFSKKQAPQPRIRAPYVPGKHDRRFWTDEEKRIVRTWYPKGGAAACLQRLGDHRTKSGVYRMANKLGVSCSTCDRKTYASSPELDQRIREEFAKLDGKKRGETAALAERLGRPRWWLSVRLRKLGLTVAHRKQPNWTAMEDALLEKLPLHDLERCAAIFREHGFNRTATSINVRSKRRGLLRRDTRPTLSATQAAKLLGVAIKSVTRHCISGDLPAVKRNDRRSVQQGGSAWDIEPGDLRRFILDNLEIIDLRKVDRVDFCLLLAREGRFGPAEAEGAI